MRRTASVMVLAVLAGLVASACATPVKAGAAAIVGDQRVTTSSVEATSTSVQEQAEAEDLGELDGATLNRITVERAIRSLLTAELAEREGVTVSQGEVDDYLAQIDDEGQTDQLTLDALNNGVPSNEIRDEVHDFLLRQKVGEELVSGTGPEAEQERLAAINDAMIALAEETNVSVSPRYGTWDAETISVLPPEDDLSRLPSGSS
jgi:parvulin-like peptidyl-prolyl isomerase